MTRARLLRLAFSLLLALLAAVAGGLSAYRKIQTFQPVGFTTDPTAAGAVRVLEVADPQTGLKPGDRILLAGTGASEPAAVLEQLRRQDEATLTVLRGKELVPVTYHRPPLDADIPYLLLALIGVGYLLIGLFTVSRQAGSPSFLFFLWCLASAVFYLLTPVPPLDALFKLSYVGDEAARLLLPALTLHFFLVFPAPLRPGARARRLHAFLYLPAAVLVFLLLDQVRRAVVDPKVLGLLDRLEFLQLGVYALAAVAVLAWRLLRGDAAWEQGRQLRWIAVGMAGGYVPFLLLYGLPWMLGLNRPELATTFAVLPLAMVPLAFAWAILRYKLWDIEVVVRDTIAATSSLMLGIIGFSLVNIAIVRGVPPELAAARNFLSFGAGLAIAGLLVPARRGISSALERIQYRGTFGKRRALGAFGRELLLERDLGRLCTAVIERIEEGVEVNPVNLYLFQGGVLGDGFAPVRPEPGLPSRLPGDGLGEELWSAQFQRLSALPTPTEPDSPSRRLFTAGYRYAFPLTVLGNHVGIVLTGAKSEGEPLNSEDSMLIRSLLDQAGLAIENAQLLGQLHRQLSEVVRLQRYTEGIFESSPAGIVVLDGAGRVVSANAAFAALVGASRGEIEGKPLAAVLPVEPIPAPGEGPLEVSFCDAAGRERYLQLSASAFAEDERVDRGSGGKAKADAIGRQARERLRILVVHDVSERVAMENALKEKDRLAALGMLAAGVAHEVNTPITGISSYAQMLLSETAESDPHYEILKKVERQTFRAARIVNNLLEFARNRQDERQPLALPPLVSEALDLLADRVKRRGIEVDWQAPSEPVLVFASDGELQQVFTNLFINAIDAMGATEDTGGRLTVRVEALAGRVKVIVEDNGPGIPADRLEKIFQPFFSTKLSKGGTGLGLAISHEIVRRHGGSLTAANRPEGGARFVVDLPRTA
jgi:two-component system NtrC family sensor kinase